VLCTVGGALKKKRKKNWGWTTCSGFVTGGESTLKGKVVKGPVGLKKLSRIEVVTNGQLSGNRKGGNSKVEVQLKKKQNMLRVWEEG